MCPTFDQRPLRRKGLTSLRERTSGAELAAQVSVDLLRGDLPEERLAWHPPDALGMRARLAGSCQALISGSGSSFEPGDETLRA